MMMPYVFSLDAGSGSSMTVLLLCHSVLDTESSNDDALCFFSGCWIGVQHDSSIISMAPDKQYWMNSYLNRHQITNLEHHH